MGLLHVTGGGNHDMHVESINENESQFAYSSLKIPKKGALL